MCNPARKLPPGWDNEKFIAFAQAVTNRLHEDGPSGKPVPAAQIGTYLLDKMPDLKPPSGWLQSLLIEVKDVRFRDTANHNNSYFLVTDIPDDDTLTVASASVERWSGQSSSMERGQSSSMHVGMQDMSASAAFPGSLAGWETSIGEMIIPARAPHINPDVDAASRVVLIDLENQHGALTFFPKSEDFVVGFVTTGGLHAGVKVETARYPVDVLVAKGVPDAADLRMVWYMAEMHFKLGLTKNTPVVIISRDGLFSSLADVMRHTVRVTVKTWETFSHDEGLD